MTCNLHTYPRLGSRAVTRRAHAEANRLPIDLITELFHDRPPWQVHPHPINFVENLLTGSFISMYYED